MKNQLVTHFGKLGKAGGALTKGKLIPANPVALADSYKMLVEANNDYKKTVEVETTKRQAIAAWRETRLLDLQNRRELLENYLKERFAERRYQIDEMFVRLDKGIADGNEQLISGALGAIVSIAAQSPLADVDKLIGDMNNESIKSIEI